MHAGEVTLASLRLEAKALRRCSPELAGLGPPTGPLRRVHQLARQACASFEQGAKCAATAALLFAGDNPTGTKLTRLLNCETTGVNDGTDLIGLAVSDGSAIR